MLELLRSRKNEHHKSFSKVKLQILMSQILKRKCKFSKKHFLSAYTYTLDKSSLSLDAKSSVLNYDFWHMLGLSGINSRKQFPVSFSLFYFLNKCLFHIRKNLHEKNPYFLSSWYFQIVKSFIGYFWSIYRSFRFRREFFLFNK